MTNDKNSDKLFISGVVLLGFGLMSLPLGLFFMERFNLSGNSYISMLRVSVLSDMVGAALVLTSRARRWTRVSLAILAIFDALAWFVISIAIT